MKTKDVNSESTNGWERIERRLDVKLPQALRSFYQSAMRCNYLTPLPPDKIVSLEFLYPQVPQRVLPVFTMPSGDILGLFFPRQGGLSFLVRFQHEEGMIVALASNLDRAFADPDRYSPDNPFNKQGGFASDDTSWRSLMIEPNGAIVPELELLKPMSLHYRNLESGSKSLFQRLSNRFGAKDARAKLVRTQFKNAADLHDRKRWIALSEGLVQLGYWSEAIQSLDNCHTILFIHPHYGNGAKRGEPSWMNVAIVFEKQLEIAMAHGDTFDRVALKHQLQIAVHFGKKE